MVHKKIVLNRVASASRFNQFLMAALINLPVVSYGLMMAWISPVAVLLKSDDTPASAPLSSESISWIASVVCFTAVPGVFLFTFLLEFFGRKFSLICLSIPYVICWIIKLSSAEPWALITARAIAGLAAGGSYAVPPIYVKEISDDKVSGILGTLLILSQNIGYIFAYLFGAILEYNTVLWISIAVPVIHIFTFMWMPESPAFLVKKGEPEKATKVLAWLRRLEETDTLITQQLESIKLEQLKAKDAPKATVISVLKNKNTKKALLLGLSLICVAEMSGYFAFSLYQGTIFHMADDGSTIFKYLTPNLQAVFVGTFQLFGSLVATACIERCGRKPLLIGTCFCTSALMAAMGAWFYLVSLGFEISGWIPVTLMSLTLFSNAAGPMPIPFVVLSDILDFQSRGQIQMIVVIFNYLMGFSLVKAFSPLVNSFGVQTVFWMFSIGSLASAVYVLFVVPETKGKTLEEIYDELNGVKKPKIKLDPDQNT